MKRQSDEENLVGADQGRDPTGDEEDVFREAGPLDLRGCRSAGSALRRVCIVRLPTPASKRERRATRREAADLPGSAGGETRHDQSGSDCAARQATDQFPLDGKSTGRQRAGNRREENGPERVRQSRFCTRIITTPMGRTICLWDWRTGRSRASIFSHGTTWGRTRSCSPDVFQFFFLRLADFFRMPRNLHESVSRRRSWTGACTSIFLRRYGAKS